MIGSKKPFIGATIRVGSIKIRVTATSVEELNIILPLQLEAMQQMQQKLEPKNVSTINNYTDKKPNKQDLINSEITSVVDKSTEKVDNKKEKNDVDHSNVENEKSIKNRKVNNATTTTTKRSRNEKSKDEAKLKRSKQLIPYKATNAVFQNTPLTIHSISMMEEYKGLSFEEIRWMQMQAIGRR